VADAGSGDCASDPRIAPLSDGNFVGLVWAEAFGAVNDAPKEVGLVPEEFAWTNAYTGDYVEGSPNSILPDGGNAGITDVPIAYGRFSSDKPDPGGFCYIEGIAPGAQYINGVRVAYAYTSVSLYDAVVAGQGSQLEASVTVTRDNGMGNPCVRRYTALGLWPAVVCNVDDDCNPLAEPSAQPPRPLGSGLLPGIPTVCAMHLAPQDPVIVPAAVLSGTGCGGRDEPYILQPAVCGGANKNQNGIPVSIADGGTGLCFYPNASSSSKLPFLAE
jgi:hypothetical protein